MTNPALLVPLRSEDGYVLDVRYATADNLTGAPIYARPVALLLPEAKALLDRAASQARALGLRIKIFDAFRPIEAQWALWNAVTDKRFVADPRQGGVHPRGAAVDVTLVDAVSGTELDMGTGFDAITDRSAHGSLEVSTEAQRNRAVLLGIMTGAGWDNYLPEWWHYQMFDARRFPPLRAGAVPDGPM
jgi:D-alanyl-D-alanine dipeptidase